MEMEYASKGTGNAALATGIIGTVGTAMGALGLGNGGLLNWGNAAGCGYVGRDAYEVQLKLIESEKNNAILSADLASEKKMVEVFNASLNRTNTVRDELLNQIRDLERKVDANSAAQAVINAQYGSQINLNTSQIAQLMSLTKMVIPNGSVCPGWGEVTVTPTPVTP